MLTPEQIRNLKEGDPLIVNVSMKKIDEDGDIWITVPGCAAHWFPPDSVSLPSEHGTSVPTPKYDPTRLFKKGDKVRVVKCKGRNYTGQTTGEIGIVDRDESPGTASVEVEFADEDMWEIDPAYLELVTPVEDLEPYKLIDSPNTYNIVRDSAMVMTIHKKSHPNAKAAAEAERDRLNAEWRKEQK